MSPHSLQTNYVAISTDSSSGVAARFFKIRGFGFSAIISWVPSDILDVSFSDDMF